MGTSHHTEPASRPETVRRAGLLLGLGLGGFVDGILLHQILQWHHLVSEVDGRAPVDLRNLQVNVLADGLFHAGTWILVFVGVLVLAEITRSGGAVDRMALLGWMAVGWGVFNLVEGVINHHLLQIHRVRPAAANPLLYDLGFLAFGVVLVGGGFVLQRRARLPLG